MSSPELLPPDRVARTLRELLVGQPLNGYAPAEMPEPWGAVVAAITTTEGTTARGSMLQRCLRSNGYADQDVNDVLLVLATAPVGKRERPAWRTFRGADLLAKHFPEPRWALPGLIPPGLTIITAKSKSGKSHLVLQVCLAISGMYGCHALGVIEVDQGDVLYVDLENGEELLQERLAAALGGYPCPESFHYTTESKRIDQGLLDDIEDWIAEHPSARLIVLDTFQSVRSRGGRKQDNAYERDYEALKPLAERAKALGVAIVIVHHTNKGNSSDPFARVNGSEGINATVDTEMVLITGDGDATLHARGRRVKPQELGLRMDPDTAQWIIVGDAAEVRRSKERTEMLDILAAAGEPLTPLEVSARCQHPHNSCKQFLWQLAQSGDLIRVKGKYQLSNKHANRARQYLDSL